MHKYARDRVNFVFDMRKLFTKYTHTHAFENGVNLLFDVFVILLLLIFFSPPGRKLRNIFHKLYVDFFNKLLINTQWLHVRLHVIGLLTVVKHFDVNVIKK